MKLLRLLALTGLAVLGSSLAWGHHAYNANYIEKRGTIEGVIVEVFWGNPHVHYYLEVSGDDGTTRLWDVEASNLGVMGRSGWTKATIEVGDRIRISGDLGREGRPRLALDRDSLEMLD